MSWVDQATGNYGTIKVDDDRSVTWAGYAIRDDWVLMSSGDDRVGIYNDTDNEWSVLCRRNDEVELYYNGNVEAKTANGYFLANNQLRAPAFFDSDDTVYYLNANATGTSLNVAGAIVAAGNVTAYSDIKFKENIKVIPDAVEKVKAMRGVTYTRNDLEDREDRHTGVIAQEVEQVLPEAVREGFNGKTVAYGNMVGLLIEAIKEQQKQIDELKATLL